MENTRKPVLIEQMKNLWFVLSILVLVVLAQGTISQSNSMSWPLSCEPGMTSAFGDYRPGHFHSGVDLKTWGRIGIPIASDGDGYVFRIGISTRGYGKALYIKLNQGGYRVYGHLSEFGPGIDSLVQKEQYARKRYSVQLYFKKDQIPVKKGQIIALSGNTGIGFPHLHYEHRSDSNVPINALSSGLKVIDKKPPVLESLAIKPFLLGSYINESEETVVLPLIKSAGDTFRTSAPVMFYGCIGLAVKGFDMADAADNHFGIYGLSLFLDDSLVFKSVRDSFSFEETQEIHLDYDLNMICKDRVPYYNLYVETGNKLPFYGRFKELSGILKMASSGTGIREGHHRLRIVASDAAQNTACAIVNITCARPPVIEQVEWQDDSGLKNFSITIGRGSAGFSGFKFLTSTSGDHWKNIQVKTIPGPGGIFRFTLDSIKSPGAFLKTIAYDSNGYTSLPFIIPVTQKSRAVKEPEIELEMVDDIMHIMVRMNPIISIAPEITVFADTLKLQIPKLYSRNPGLYEIRFRSGFVGQKIIHITISVQSDSLLKYYKKDYPVCGLTAKGCGEAVSIDKKGYMNVVQGGVVRDACLMVMDYADSVKVKDLKEIIFNRMAYTAFPKALYYDRQIRAAIVAPHQNKAGLFIYTGDNYWKFLSDNYDEKKGCFYGMVMQNTPFGLFSDTIPPNIKLKMPGKAGDTVTSSELLLYVRDEGAGIGSDKDVVTYMDGRWILSEYDFKSDAVKVSLKGVSHGRHVLTIEALDNLKNESKMDLPFIRK